MRRTRRRSRWRLWLGLMLLAILAVAVVGGVVLWQRASAFNEAVSTSPALSMRLFGPFSPARVNVVLLGYSDESREGAYLSDSMNVLSIDKESGVTSLIAIPRDLWVEGVPGVPQNMKINEAFRIGYYDGGVEAAGSLTASAVAHVTGLRIDGWISLDFQGFRRMVDRLGGVTVNNPRAFEYTWRASSFESSRFQHRFKKGTLHLNGRRALDYARARYTDRPAESSDFARSVRQQRVLTALKGKVGIGQIAELTEALEGHLHTNLSVLDVGMLAGNVEVDRRVELPEGEILQATTNTVGQYILVVLGQSSTSDYRPLHAYIADQLAAPIPSASSPPSPTP